MGTRSLVVFEKDGSEIAVLYRQYDGYPSGMGKDLADFLTGKKMVNGITDRDDNIANGMGCLAAQVVKHLKDCVGNVYLEPAGTRDCWEEYVYYINGEVGDQPTIRVMMVQGYEENRKEVEIFSGYPDDLLIWLEKEREEEEESD